MAAILVSEIQWWTYSLYFTGEEDTEKSEVQKTATKFQNLGQVHIKNWTVLVASAVFFPLPIQLSTCRRNAIRQRDRDMDERWRDGEGERYTLIPQTKATQYTKVCPCKDLSVGWQHILFHF